MPCKLNLEGLFKNIRNLGKVLVYFNLSLLIWLKSCHFSKLSLFIARKRTWFYSNVLWMLVFAPYSLMSLLSKEKENSTELCINRLDISKIYLHFPFWTQLWHFLGSGNCSTILSSIGIVESPWVVRHIHLFWSRSKA